MTSIGLITTGECERRALGDSLQRAFGLESRYLIHSLQRPVDSITSRRLEYPGPPRAVTSEPTLVDELVGAVMSEIEKRDAPDFVFAIDDLELVNMKTPENVTRLVADAFQRYLHSSTRTHREFARVRERCSFHLLCPMVEAYFFGESASLVRAGARRPAILNPTHHLEDFLADGDIAFIIPSHVQGHGWRTPERVRHPKHYLKFLVDPDDSRRASSRYREGRDGRRALCTLDWAQVFAYQPPGIAFAHALFDDLADALGVENPFPGACHPLTERRPEGTLRNIV